MGSKGNGKGQVTDPMKARHIPVGSDSDSEGFVEKTSFSPKASGKASSGKLKSGKKAVSEKSKATGKASLSKAAVKDDSGKGGKDTVSGKAGSRGSLPKLPPPTKEVELTLEMEVPHGSKVLMDCEASDVLQGIEERLTSLLKDPRIKIPQSFEKAVHYLKSGVPYTKIQPVREALDILKKYGVRDGEICMIANICPESVDEVYALIPSLKAHRIKNEHALRTALGTLSKYRKSSQLIEHVL